MAKLLSAVINLFLGRALWIRLVKKYNLKSNQYVIIFPETNMHYNYLALQYCDEFLNFKKSNGAVFIISDIQIRKTVELFTDKIIDIINIPKIKLDRLLKYNELYRFTSNLIIISFQYGCDADVTQLLGKRGIGLSDLICIGIYGMTEIPTTNVPRY